MCGRCELVEVSKDADSYCRVIKVRANGYDEVWFYQDGCYCKTGRVMLFPDERCDMQTWKTILLDRAEPMSDIRIKDEGHKFQSWVRKEFIRWQDEDKNFNPKDFMMEHVENAFVRGAMYVLDYIRNCQKFLEEKEEAEK